MSARAPFTTLHSGHIIAGMLTSLLLLSCSGYSSDDSPTPEETVTLAPPTMTPTLTPTLTPSLTPTVTPPCCSTPTGTPEPGSSPTQTAAPSPDVTASTTATPTSTPAITPTLAPTPTPLEQVADFSLRDVNPASSRFNDSVSPRDYLDSVSAWYFGHAT
ncbi:MAG: hypothetical protein ACKO6N_07140 [Myxococcota bacterium]